MMKSAAEISPEAVTQRALRSENGPSRSKPHRLHQLPRVWDLQQHHLAGGQHSGFQLADPLRSMDAKYVLIARRLRPHEIFARRNLLRDKRLGNQPKLLRRENMRPQIQIIFIVVDNLKGKHVLGRGAAWCAPARQDQSAIARQFSRAKIKSGKVINAREYSESPCPFKQAFARRAYSCAKFRARSSAPDSCTRATIVSGRTESNSFSSSTRATNSRASRCPFSMA